MTEDEKRDLGYLLEDVQGVCDKLKIIEGVIYNGNLEPGHPNRAEWWTIRTMVRSGINEARGTLEASCKDYLESVVEGDEAE